jgi:hypothetical protein
MDGNNYSLKLKINCLAINDIDLDIKPEDFKEMSILAETS